MSTITAEQHNTTPNNASGKQGSAGWDKQNGAPPSASLCQSGHSPAPNVYISGWDSKVGGSHGASGTPGSIPINPSHRKADSADSEQWQQQPDQVRLPFLSPMSHLFLPTSTVVSISCPCPPLPFSDFTMPLFFSAEHYRDSRLVVVAVPSIRYSRVRLL